MNRHWLIAILIFAGVFVFASDGLKGGPEVSAKEAAALLKGEPRPVVIDLRERADYDQGRIAGAIGVPHGEFKARLESLKLPKMEVIVLYGNDDARAREATKHLYDNGYQGALTLKGGFEAWHGAGFGIEKPPSAKTP